MGDSQLTPQEIIERLKEQNLKLKSEYDTLNEALQKTLNAKKPRSPQRVPSMDVSDPRSKEMKTALKQIKALKREVQQLNLMLNTKEEERGTELTDELNWLKQRLDEVESERRSFNAIKEEQSQAVERLGSGQDYMKKLQNLQAEERAGANAFQELRTKLMNDRSTWRNEHSKMIETESKIRKLKAKPVTNDIEGEQIERQLAQSQKKLEVAQKSYKTEETKAKRNMALVEGKIKSAQDELQPVQKSLDTRGEEICFKQKKISDLKRQIRTLQHKKDQSGPSMNFKTEQELPQKSKLTVQQRAEDASQANDAVASAVESLEDNVFSKPQLKF